MNCERAEELLIDALSGALDPDRERELEDHLAICDDCGGEARKLRDTWSALDAIDESAVPSDRMRIRFRAALGAYEAGLEHSLGRRFGRWTRRLAAGFDRSGPELRLAAGAAVLVVGLVLGWGANRWLGGGGEVARLRAEMESMNRAVTLALLEHQSASERLRGVSWSAGAGSDDRVLSALVDVVRHDSSVNVRLAAVEALAAHAGRPQVREGLFASLEDRPEPHLQLAVTRALAGEDTPSGDLERLLASDLLDPEVRELLDDESGQI